MLKEIEKRKAYNRTVGELGRLSQCSRTARNQINRTIAENEQIIRELSAFGELTSTPQAGAIAADKEPDDGPSGNAGSRNGRGSDTGNFDSIGVHLQGERQLRRRYFKAT